MTSFLEFLKAPIGSNLFVSRSGQTDLLIKLYARVIAPAGKVKTTKLFVENYRDSSKCLSE